MVVPTLVASRLKIERKANVKAAMMQFLQECDLTADLVVDYEYPNTKLFSIYDDFQALFAAYERQYAFKVFSDEEYAAEAKNTFTRYRTVSTMYVNTN